MPTGPGCSPPRHSADELSRITPGRNALVGRWWGLGPGAVVPSVLYTVPPMEKVQIPEGAGRPHLQRDHRPGAFHLFPPVSSFGVSSILSNFSGITLSNQESSAGTSTTLRTRSS